MSAIHRFPCDNPTPCDGTVTVGRRVQYGDAPVVWCGTCDICARWYAMLEEPPEPKQGRLDEVHS